MSDEMSRTVRVPNISCGHCVNTIEREVGGVPGVCGVKGEVATRRVTVSWDPDTTDWVVIEDTMKDIAYPPAGEV
jgi:copper chaperone CopZ